MDTKTRLIDAYSMYESLRKDKLMSHGFKMTTARIISNQPTVPAIPIAWLEEQRDKSSGFRHAVLSETIEKWEGERNEFHG